MHAQEEQETAVSQNRCGCRIWITPKPLFYTALVPLIRAETTNSLWSNSSPGIVPNLALL